MAEPIQHMKEHPLILGLEDIEGLVMPFLNQLSLPEYRSKLPKIKGLICVGRGALGATQATLDILDMPIPVHYVRLASREKDLKFNKKNCE